MLASDRDREATVLRLRAAHLEGRIDHEELEERIGRAHASRTREELDEVASDLPDRQGQPIALTSGVPRVPGRRHFSERKLLDAPPAEVRESMLVHVVPALERFGFYVHRETGDTLVLENRWQTGSRVTVRLRDAGDGRTLVLAHGTASLRVRRAFATLSDG
jgi:uncharacterized protein DUF1707